MRARRLNWQFLLFGVRVCRSASVAFLAHKVAGGMRRAEARVAIYMGISTHACAVNAHALRHARQQSSGAACVGGGNKDIMHPSTHSDGVKGVVSVSSPFHQLAIGTYMVCDFKSEAVRQGGELRIGRHRLGCDSCGRRCSVWLRKLFVCECVCNPFVGGLVAVAAVGRRCDVFDRSISKHC